MQKQRMVKSYIIILFVVLLITPNHGISGSVGDYLIMQDIKANKIMGSGGGKGSGIVTTADHFSIDHSDESFEAIYFNDASETGVQVQVTTHTGSDSDKWLLHEVEDGFKDNLGATYISPNPLRNISGNNIFYTWGYYDWISNYVVVSIKFTNMTSTKPEPLEVVQAYLQKFPSTIPPTIALDNAHKIQWIKDEMDRRLWLCDKWFMQLQLKKVEEKQVYQESVKSMNIFLDYREKYYGIKAADEKNLLAGYLNTNNGTGIKAKLKEYKDWWVVNKDKQISIP
jgi:hypothetical protein